MYFTLSIEGNCNSWLAHLREKFHDLRLCEGIKVYELADANSKDEVQKKNFKNGFTAVYLKIF